MVIKCNRLRKYENMLVEVGGGWLRENGRIQKRHSNECPSD